MFLSIQDAIKQGLGEVSVRGWVYRERGSSNIKFIVLRDSTNIIQCVIEKAVVGEKNYSTIDKVQIEASMEITGTIKEDKRAPTGYEIHVNKFAIVGESDTYPIQKDQSVDFLADNRHLWLRSRKMVAIMKIRSTIFGAIDEFCRSNGFYEFQSPIFQSTQCEGGSTLFKVDYFNKPMYLTQTWQLFAEAAIFGLEKIYCISPCFRAEKSKTSRHLTEFWMMEMEAAWFQFKDIQDFAENMIKFVIKKVVDVNFNELKILERDVSKLMPAIEKPFVRITYDEAVKTLNKKNVPIEWGKDLRTVEEDELMKMYDVPVIVQCYPKVVKAFYMKENPLNPDTVLGFDMLAPEGYGEIVGASEREADINKIRDRLAEQGEDPKNYEFYLDTRRYGSVPHAGFGMGVERLIAWICGLDSIKDAIAFPRTMIRYTP